MLTDEIPAPGNLMFRSPRKRHHFQMPVQVATRQFPSAPTSSPISGHVVITVDTDQGLDDLTRTWRGRAMTGSTAGPWSTTPAPTTARPLDERILGGRRVPVRLEVPNA